MIQNNRKIFVDNFAGGGGASTGIEMAIGRSVDIAINHDPDAIAMHKANHPETKHYCEDVWEVDPVEACDGRQVSLAWFSPDCKHFSRAKGGKPVDKKIRGLAWVAIRWALLVRPDCIMLENVPEIMTWCPLDDNGKPIKDRKGETFDGFISILTDGLSKSHPAFVECCDALSISVDSDYANKLSHGLRYKVEYKTLKSCDYGAPTTRTRFYMIARSDNRDIVWAEPTHAPKNSEEVKQGLLKPYRSAAECINWNIPAKSIFEREKPLAENTLRRIAKGIQKFVIDNPEPFIVNYKFNNPPEDISNPLSTVTAVNSHYVVTPTLIPIGYGENMNQEPRTHNITEPLPTVVSSGKHYLVAPTLIQYHSEQNSSEVRGQKLDEPLMTVDASPRYALSVAELVKKYSDKKPNKSIINNDCKNSNSPNGLVASHILTFRNNIDGQNMDEPLSTISCSGAHHAEVQAFLVKYYGTGAAKSINDPIDTVTVVDRFALVTIHGEDYIISDIKMRMLEPRELFDAQGFPSDYIIDVDCNGRKYSRSKQVARCGNAVTPPVTEALVRANLPECCSTDSKWRKVA